MEYPNMLSEVLEAIHLYHEDNPDVETDCYRYLIGLCLSAHSESWLNKLCIGAKKALTEMGRCERCGHLLAYYSYPEYHPEVDATEYMHELVCPVCDLGKEDDR